MDMAEGQDVRTPRKMMSEAAASSAAPPRVASPNTCARSAILRCCIPLIGSRASACFVAKGLPTWSPSSSILRLRSSERTDAHNWLGEQIPALMKPHINASPICMSQYHCLF